MIEIGSVLSVIEFVLKLFGWRFFLKPDGLEFAFLNTWNLSLLSFFLFFVLISNTKRHRIIGILFEGMRVDLKDRSLRKGCKILSDG
jgi:hypothetical protein